MLIPPKERVIYKNATLEQVVCQITFNPILTIEATVPFKFQELVRENFPLLEQHTQIDTKLSQQGMTQEQVRVYSFINESHDVKIDLTKETLAVFTKQYTDWLSFYHHVERAIDAADDAYSIPSIKALDLKYVNTFKKTKLGQPVEASWTELVHPWFLGAIADETLRTGVTALSNQFDLDLGNGQGKVNVTLTKGLDTFGEEVLQMQAGFFVDKKLALSEIEQYLKVFNESSRNLLRHVVTEKMHLAMQPTGGDIGD